MSNQKIEKPRKEDHWTSWIVLTMKMPPSQKARLEKMSLDFGQSQAKLMRWSFDMFSAEYASTEEDREVAALAVRQREEIMSIEKAKDGHKTAMRVVSASDTIEKEKKNFKRLEILRPFHYESWLRRVLDNVAAISKENPERDVAIKTLYLLFEKYMQESVDLAKQLQIDGYVCPVKWPAEWVVPK